MQEESKNIYMQFINAHWNICFNAAAMKFLDATYCKIYNKTTDELHDDQLRK